MIESRRRAAYLSHRTLVHGQRITRLSRLAKTALIFVAAAGIALFAATQSVQFIEDVSEINVRDALDDNEMPWAEVQADGLQVILEGTAPSEAARVAAISAAGTAVDAARIIDAMDAEDAAALAPPRFSAELLRNDAGLSIIGLVPTSTDRDDIKRQIERIEGSDRANDLLESADYPAPTGWEDALGFALTAIDRLPRSKVSVEAGRISIEATVDSAEAKAKLEQELNRAAPPGLRMALAISAPRPVITPFTLRFVKEEVGARFDACSADTAESQARILAAAQQAGLEGEARCAIGLGVPSTRWAEAVELALTALTRLEKGTVTFSDADIMLVGAEGTDQAAFDRVVGELENDLPDVFVLRAILPKTAEPSLGPAEFTATLSPEGQVQLRGRLSDEHLRSMADSYARAAFGSDTVHMAARVVEDLPADWTVRVLAGLEALAKLKNGALTVTPERVEIRGKTGQRAASTEIASLFADKLGDSSVFDIAVEYQEELDPIAALPTADECEAEIQSILAVSKISFEPGSATIDASALGTLDDIAEILKQCGSLRLEIQGHTDSQGREIMNLDLSQARAQSVLNELRVRRVLTSSFTAKGYGETVPIADNKTEEGREANRRIEFHLIRPEPSVIDTETTLESVATSGDIGAGDDAAGASDTEDAAVEEDVSGEQN